MLLIDGLIDLFMSAYMQDISSLPACARPYFNPEDPAHKRLHPDILTGNGGDTINTPADKAYLA